MAQLCPTKWLFKTDISTIEGQLPFSLDWQRLDNRKASRIITKIEDLDFDNQANYYELMDEVISRVIAMRKVFKDYIMNIEV